MPRLLASSLACFTLTPLTPGATVREYDKSHCLLNFEYFRNSLLYIVDYVTKTLVKRNLNGGVAGDPYPMPAQALPLKLYDVTLYDVRAHLPSGY